MKLNKNKSCISFLLSFSLIVNVPVYASSTDNIEYYNGNNLLINKVVDSSIDVEIDGNTLVNLAQKKPVTSYESNLVIKDGLVTGYSKDYSNAGFYFEPTPESINMMRGKKVTVFLYGVYASSDSEIITYNRTTATRYRMHKNLNDDIGSPAIAIDKVKKDIRFVVDIPNDIKDTDDLEFIMANPKHEGSWTRLYDKLMILEGDWRGKEAPEYFTGMKSVGESHSGENNLEIYSDNENLFDDSQFSEFETVNINGYECYDFRDIKGQHIKLKKPFRVKGGHTYYLTSKVIRDYSEGTDLSENQYIGFSFEPNEGLYGNPDALFFVSGNSNTQNVVHQDIVRFEAPKDILLTDLSVVNYGSTDERRIYLVKDSLMLKSEKNFDLYSESKRNEISVSFDEPLRKVSDIAVDKLIKTEKSWVVERNCEEVVLNGSEDWWPNSTINENSTHAIFYNNTVAPLVDYTNNERKIICDKLPVEYNNGGVSSFVNTGNTISRYHYSKYSDYIYLKVALDELNSYDSEGIKEWLSKNPVTITFQSNKPKYEDVNYSSLGSYYEMTHISNNSIIPCEMSVAIDRELNIVKDAIDLAKANPTTENLTRARSLVNRMKESILKDSFQQEVNNVTQLEDLTFDRKNMSANLDVYIKSENMLSMSLDTNSVSFEGYSGAAPMELKDVVNITINSSLPYDLNAYMPIEISNSDGSSKIDFDIFNIKESSESTYQQFEDTVNEIVLKSDCAKGNNKSHKIDLKLDSNTAHKADVYKTVIRFEAIQK